VLWSSWLYLHGLLWSLTIIVRTNRQKEAELAARERRSMKRRRILWAKKWLLRRAQFGQYYDKRKHFGRWNFAQGCGCLAEGRGRFTFCLRSIRFLHGLRGFLTFHSFPQDSCGKIKQRAEGHGNVRFIGGIFAVSCGSLLL